MRKLVLIKLGGSLITDKTKPLTAKNDLIKPLGSELAGIKSRHQLDLIVGTGAGSFGHYLVLKNNMGKSGPIVDKKQAIEEVHLAVAKLNRTVMQSIGSNVVQFDGLSVEKHDRDIKRALNNNQIVSVYGDIIARNDMYEVLSTEELFEHLLADLAATYDQVSVIFATSMPGVVDAAGDVIQKLDVSDIKQLKWHNQEGFDVTGGMKQKVEASIKLLKWADYVRIIDGRMPAALDQALQNKSVGTLIQ